MTAFQVLYGVAAIPVGLWTLFHLWAVSKQRYDGEPLRPLIPYFLQAAAVPALWILGILGATILAHLGKRWSPWATWFFVALCLAFVWVATPLRFAFGVA